MVHPERREIASTPPPSLPRSFAGLSAGVQSPPLSLVGRAWGVARPGSGPVPWYFCPTPGFCFCFCFLPGFQPAADRIPWRVGCKIPFLAREAPREGGGGSSQSRDREKKASQLCPACQRRRRPPSKIQAPLFFFRSTPGSPVALNIRRRKMRWRLWGSRDPHLGRCPWSRGEAEFWDWVIGYGCHVESLLADIGWFWCLVFC